MTLGITASRVGGHHPLKACPTCMETDLATHGHAFWHIEHQFPSVFVCAEHGTPLRVAWDPTTPVHRRGWILPTTGLQRSWLDLAVPHPESWSQLQRLARFSASWAELLPASLTPDHLSLTYRIALAAHGIVTPAGSLRLPVLVKFIRDRYHGLESLPGMQILESVNAEWPGMAAALTRVKPRLGHPLKHLLLIAALFDTWPDFLDAYRGAIASESESPQPAPPRPSLRQLAEDHFIQLVKNDGLSITAAAREVGVTTSTGIRWAKMRAIAYKARPKSLRPETLECARALLVEGLDKASISEQCRISAVSLNRLISSEPAIATEWRTARTAAARALNRDRFLRAIALNPGVNVSELRRLPRSGYMWLYRNDRDWLMDHLPAIWDRCP